MIITPADIEYALGGFAAGCWTNLIRLRRRPPAPTGPVCQCDHKYVFHDADGKCTFVHHVYDDRQVIQRYKNGDPIRDTFDRPVTHLEKVLVNTVVCTCQGYVRTEPPTRPRTRNNHRAS